MLVWGERGRQRCCVPSAACVGVCCLCSSGESGAGKTESCKFIVGHLTELSHAKSLTEQKIIQVGGACHPGGWGMSSRWGGMSPGGWGMSPGGWGMSPGGWGLLSQHSYVTSRLVCWVFITVCVSMHVLSSPAPSSSPPPPPPRPLLLPAPSSSPSPSS